MTVLLTVPPTTIAGDTVNAPHMEILRELHTFSGDRQYHFPTPIDTMPHPFQSVTSLARVFGSLPPRHELNWNWYHIGERRQMMQQWADYLESLKESASIIQFQT